VSDHLSKTFANSLNVSMVAIEDLKINMRKENPKKIKTHISQETKKILERIINPDHIMPKKNQVLHIYIPLGFYFL